MAAPTHQLPPMPQAVSAASIGAVAFQSWLADEEEEWRLSQRLEASCPKEFKCPISLDIMQDPIILVETGMTYDRDQIRKWLLLGGSKCPLTGVQLVTRKVISHKALKRRIDRWVASGGIPEAALPLAADLPMYASEASYQVLSQGAPRADSLAGSLAHPDSLRAESVAASAGYHSAAMRKASLFERARSEASSAGHRQRSHGHGAPRRSPSQPLPHPNVSSSSLLLQKLSSSALSKITGGSSRAESSETSPRSAIEASGGAPSAGRISGADPPGSGGSSVTASQASGHANAAAAGAQMSLLKAQRGQIGEAAHGSPASVKGRAAAFEALQGAPVLPQQPGDSPAARDSSALRKPPAARCGDAVPERGQSASPAAVLSTSEAPGVPAEPVEAPGQLGPQQHAAPRWALDTSGKQLLAFFDKDLLASGHAAMTTAADEEMSWERGRVGGDVEQPIPRDLQDTQQGGPDSHSKGPDDCQTSEHGAAAPALASHPVGDAEPDPDEASEEQPDVALAELEAALAHCAAPAKERAAGDPGNSQSTKSSSSAVETISVIATAEMIVKPSRSRVSCLGGGVQAKHRGSGVRQVSPGEYYDAGRRAPLPPSQASMASSERASRSRQMPSSSHSTHGVRNGSAQHGYQRSLPPRARPPARQGMGWARCFGCNMPPSLRNRASLSHTSSRASSARIDSWVEGSDEEVVTVHDFARHVIVAAAKRASQQAAASTAGPSSTVD